MDMESEQACHATLAGFRFTNQSQDRYNARLMRRLPLVVAVLVACSGGGGSGPETAGGREPGGAGGDPGEPKLPEKRPVTIAVVGTSDLHGHIEMLPILSGYLANLRAAKGIDAVLLLDGGDMFQGTL